MSGRTIAAIFLVVALGIGAAVLGVTAYNAGVSAGLAQNVAESGGGVVVAPGYPAGPYVGYGWGGGFSFFWFFGFLLFLFIVFGLIRAVFGWGRGWGRGYGPGYGRGWDSRHEAWNDRVRQVHDELHRGGPAASGATGSVGSSSPGDASPPRT